MKKIFISAGLLLLLGGIGLTGCYKNVILPDAAFDPDGPAQAVSYKLDVAPILNTKCAISGCHISGAKKPFLATVLSYQELVNGGFVNTTIPKESILYKAINGSMKEYIPSASDRQKVYDWIRNGALNN
ncbi:MAG TPA: hypothetical protein VI548_10740 [Chitinophagaceae bacterium]|nr:hypothetical protein [Chitinophagaceae bacterium]